MFTGKVTFMTSLDRKYFEILNLYRNMFLKRSFKIILFSVVRAGKVIFGTILRLYLRPLDNYEGIASVKEQSPMDNFKLVLGAISCSFKQILYDATAKNCPICCFPYLFSFNGIILTHRDKV